MEKIETDYGYKEVFSNGDTHHYNHNVKLHNPNGPAINHQDGFKEYCINGVLHRTDGPAVEFPDVGELYYKHGKLHRTDGPAVICDNFELHFINGKYVWKR